MSLSNSPAGDPNVYPSIIGEFNSNSIIVDDFNRPNPALSNRKLIRNNQGLLNNIEYKFFPDGRVNYRAMLKAEHLYVKASEKERVEKLFGKPLSEIDVTTLDDKYLIINLAGIKYLANLRGYTKVNPQVSYVSEQKCVVTTTIDWIPNFESSFCHISYGDVASASLSSVSDSYRIYLESIAANRAFVRAVRNFLGINVVADQELKDSKSPSIENSEDSPFEQSFSPSSNLANCVKEKGGNFLEFKSQVITKGVKDLKSNPENWQNWEDIPPGDVYILLTLIKTKNEK